MSAIPSRIFHPESLPERGEGHDLAGLCARLGIPAADHAALVEAIRAGFPARVVDALARELDLPIGELLAVLGLAPATLSRRRRARKPLTPAESDRIYRILSAWQAALRLFEGDEAAARRWLKRPARALGGVSPLGQLDTEAGADAVHDLIGRLEHGVVV